MKIGFLSKSLMNPVGYYDKLSESADCWWGIVNQEVLTELEAKDYSKIVFEKEVVRLDTNKKFGNPFVTDNPGQCENTVAKKINPDVWITETLNRLSVIPKEVPWIQIFHSMPMKKHFFYPALKDYDLLLLPGEYHKQELIKRLELQDNDERLKVVGWPRIDDFVNGVFDREKIIKDLGLNPDRKTVLYAPTWGWGGTNKMLFGRSFGHDVEVFENLCKKMEALKLNFIVKLHGLAVPTYNKELIEVADKYGVIWMTKEPECFVADPNEYLWITDILISDLSGIITDFLVLDRPILYIDPDASINAWDDSDMPKEFRAGHIIETYEQFVEALEDAVANPGRFSQERKAVLDKLIYKPDGKALDRAVQEVLTFIETKVPCAKNV